MRTVESSWYYIQRRRLCLPYQPPNPIPYKKYKQQQTNENYTNIVHPCGTSNNTSWNIWESSTLLIECLSVSIDSVSTLSSMFRVDLMLSHYLVLCEGVY
jgi:hypothetical protein